MLCYVMFMWVEMTIFTKINIGPIYLRKQNAMRMPTECEKQKYRQRYNPQLLKA